MGQPNLQFYYSIEILIDAGDSTFFEAIANKNSRAVGLISNGARCQVHPNFTTSADRILSTGLPPCNCSHWRSIAYGVKTRFLTGFLIVLTRTSRVQNHHVLGNSILAAIPPLPESCFHPAMPIHPTTILGIPDF